MKIKSLIISALLLPAFLFAANTNLVDNLRINTSLRDLGTASFDGAVTIGDAPADTVTFNANTATVVGALNWNANTMVITNNAVFFNSTTNSAGSNAKIYVNGNVRADNYMYNILPTAYSSGGNTIDFSTNMVVNITGVTAGVTLTSANLMAGRSVSIIFQGTTSNILVTVPTGWVPVSQTFAAVITNKFVVIHALSLGTVDSNVVYSIAQQP